MRRPLIAFGVIAPRRPAGDRVRGAIRRFRRDLAPPADLRLAGVLHRGVVPTADGRTRFAVGITNVRSSVVRIHLTAGTHNFFDAGGWITALAVGGRLRAARPSVPRSSESQPVGIGLQAAVAPDGAVHVRTAVGTAARRDVVSAHQKATIAGNDRGPLVGGDRIVMAKRDSAQLGTGRTDRTRGADPPSGGCPRTARAVGRQYSLAG